MVDPVADRDRRAARYRRLAARYERRFARVDRVISTIAIVRFAAFAVAFLCVLAGLYERVWLPVYGPAALAALAVYVVAVRLHHRPYALAPRLQMGARLCHEAVARLEGRFDALPDDGARFLDPNEPALGELQVFGRTSLFALINRAGLPAGRRRLAALLRDGLDAAEIPARQAAAAELARLAVLRRRLAIEARLVDFDEAAMAQVFAWAEHGEDISRRLRPLVVLAALLVPATAVQFVLTLGFDIPTWWELTLGAQLVLWLATTRRLSARYVPLLGEAHHQPFAAIRAMFALVERRRFGAPVLIDRRDALGHGEKGRSARPSERLAGFEAIVGALEVRHSGLLYVLVSVGLCWELFHGWRLERWRVRHGRRLRGDLAELADVEALAAIGGFAADQPGFTWPVVRPVDADGPPIEARRVGHPLFAVEGRVHNDFTLAERGRLVLITGSNMSGKSSFLRTLGVNARLAFAAAPVCAEHLALVRCAPSTSIQITDAPEQGLSRFYAEVKRIRRVLDEVDAAEAPGTPPRLYLVDEMLSGTNSRERHLAARTIVRRLVDARRSFGLVTTHDLALVGVADDLPAQVICAHFSDRFDGEKLHFDYTLKPGVATTTNALHVLAMEGIEVPVEPTTGDRSDQSTA
ncbi:MAG: hypothetical protein H6705_16135 [Myxococcales bacterium]|nr:hypothetical protein [Myxococcales bacterium]